ncbi:MAG TPA: nuclear transport factor 2 family protein, partial [Rhodothermales bacterium]|nr:nuclear transport factor 2 family protein [Rhodothermales bacterium]
MEDDPMPTPQETEAEVRDAVLAFFRAGSEPGMEAVDATLALLADDYTGFGTGPNDYYPDRASFGAHILRERALMPTASTFEVAWMRVRELRPGLALVAVQVRFSIAMGGQTHVVEPLGTIVLERRDGRWLFAHFHFALGNAAQQEGDTLLHALQDRNRQLEEEVARRTAELEGTLAELRATQSRLVQQEKLAGLGRLTAGIAHEIKNPLNFVNNFAALSVELADEADEALAAPTPDTAEARALLADLRVNA